MCIVADHTTVMFDPEVSGNFPVLDIGSETVTNSSDQFLV